MKIHTLAKWLEQLNTSQVNKILKLRGHHCPLFLFDDIMVLLKKEIHYDKGYD